MNTAQITSKDIYNINALIKIYEDTTLNRRTVLYEELKTLEVLIINFEMILEKIIPQNSSYYENLLNYFYHCLENIKYEIEQIRHIDSYCSHKIMNNLKKRIKILIGKISRLSAFLKQGDKLCS